MISVICEEDVADRLGYVNPARMVEAWRRGLSLPRPVDFKRVAEALERPPVEVILHAMLDEAPDLAPEICDALERLGMYAPTTVVPTRSRVTRSLSVDDPHDTSLEGAERQVRTGRKSAK